MNFDAMLALSASVIILLVGFRVWLLDTKRRQYRVFFVLSVLLSWMSFGWYEMAQTTDLAVAQFWRKAQAIWAFVTPVIFYLIYVFADDENRDCIPKWVWQSVFGLVFGLAFYFYYLEISGVDPHGEMYLLDSGRWALQIDPRGPNFYLRGVWTLFCYLATLWVLFLTYRSETVQRNRRWKLILVILLTLAGIGTITQNYILPFYGIMMPINESANTLVATFLFAWAMSDFKLIEYYADPSFEELASPIPDLLILTSKSWNVQNMNPAAQDFFGAHDLNGTPLGLSQLFSADMRTQIEQRLIKKGEPLILIMPDPQGVTKHFSLTSSPVSNRRGDTIGYLVHGRNMSRYQNAIDESKAIAEQLRKSNEALERFAYIASHDIKEPARTIANFVGLLRRSLGSSISTAVREQLDFLENNSKRLHQIINSVLEFSLLSKQAEEASFSVIDMNSLLEEVLMEIDSVLSAHNAKVHVAKLPEIYAKEMMIKLLVTNLICNGVKFNKNAEPQVWFSSYQEEEQHVIAVKDNGIGIAPVFQDQIFEMYQRLHPWSEFEGTGIGLAMCKQIVEDAGGIIWVESDGKSGSTFYFSLPLRESAG